MTPPSPRRLGYKPRGTAPPPHMNGEEQSGFFSSPVIGGGAPAGGGGVKKLRRRLPPRIAGAIQGLADDRRQVALRERLVEQQDAWTRAGPRG